MSWRRVARVLLGSALPLGTIAVFWFNGELADRLGQVRGRDAGVPNFPDYSPTWQRTMLVLVVVALVVSVSGSICVVILRHASGPFEHWYASQSVWGLLIIRVVFTIVAWIGLSTVVAWHDNIAPLTWLRYDVLYIVEFALFQLLLAGGVWAPFYAPRGTLTLLPADEVNHVVGHLKQPNMPADDSSEYS